MRDLHDILIDIGLDRLSTTPKGFKACCAVNDKHIDSNPSMHIDIQRGFVKCFSCGKFKTLFDFLLEKDIPFDEAIEYFFTDFDGLKNTKETEELQEYVLGRKVPRSMVDRGFTIATLKHFKVGFDKYENRITIPLYYKKKLYGVNYREKPKKIYSSEGFNKDRFIYNYKPTDVRVYTEGFTDTWRIWQNGTKNISATLNSYPSEGQLELMRHHKEVWMAYDNDYAGFRGLYKVHHEIGRDVEVKVIGYRAEDAGECSKKEWQKGIENPISFLEFQVNLIKRNEALHDRIIKELKIK